MIYRRRKQAGVPGGIYHFQGKNRSMTGSSDGDFIRLKDEFGNEYRGLIERGDDNTVRYRLRDNKGNYVSGIADGPDVILRDKNGNTWRGSIS